MSTTQEQFSFTRGASGDRSGLLLLVLLMLLAEWHGVGQPSTAATATNATLPAKNPTVPRRNRLQEVKDFMQSPPNVELAIWQSTRYEPKKAPVRSYFLARWQKNHILFREAPSVDALHTNKVFPAMRLFGRYGTNFACLGPDARSFTFGYVSNLVEYDNKESYAY